MRRSSALGGVLALALALCGALLARAQSPSPAPLTRPTLAEARRDMALPSHDDVRGRIDSTAYAFTPAQMAKVWTLAEAPPAPDSFAPPPAPGWPASSARTTRSVSRAACTGA